MSYIRFKGATSSANGLGGMLPPPASGDQNSAIMGDGTYAIITGGSEPGSRVSGDYSSRWITNVPAGGITTYNIQDALNELDTKKSASIDVVPNMRGVYTVLPITGGGNLTGDLYIGSPAASSSIDGYLTSGDWSSFSAKESVLSFSLPLSRLVNAVSIPASSSSSNGYLASGDWDTFNNKQPPGNYQPSGSYATSTQGTKADNVGAVNGIIKSDGAASFSAAANGVDYLSPTGNGTGVTGVNAYQLNGATFLAPGPIGGTPSTITGTSITAQNGFIASNATANTICYLDANKTVQSAILSGVSLVSGVISPILSFNTQTGSYTLALPDSYKWVQINAASANVLTIPANSGAAFSIGCQILIEQSGTGQATISPFDAGVTLHSRGAAFKMAGQYATAALVQTAANVWNLSGDLTTT